MRSPLKRLLWISLLVASGAASSAGQAPAQPEAAVNLTPGAAPASPELIATLAQKDRELFDAGFGCKPDALKALVADDFEFFHDKHGQSFNSGVEFVAGIAAGCERQKAGTDFRARRELVEGSMTVHVLKGYGAMQMGVHRFYAVHAGKPDQLTETGKFIHLWKLDQGEWKLARVISYDHVLADTPK
ncbi:MAG TPA: nuclear transport factor 2 family protein [Lysobacter sp.]|nr:nuclear transport factor 2 family protein [Lysobacter sp.]